MRGSGDGVMEAGGVVVKVRPGAVGGSLPPLQAADGWWVDGSQLIFGA